MTMPQNQPHPLQAALQQPLIAVVGAGDFGLAMGRAIGPLAHARYIEPYAMLGIQLAVQRRYWHGFARGVLQRECAVL